MAWSAADLRSHTYRIYVDNAGAPLVGVQCTETTTGDGYPCTAPLPPLGLGRHVLQLTSIRDGVESPRSAPLNVTRVASLELSHTTLMFDGGPDGTAASGDHGIAMSGTVTAMVALPDGRLLAVEDAQRVRVIQNDRLVHEPALALDASRTSIEGLAVDADFATTRMVFVAWADRRGPEGSELHVTRYREFRNSLYDAATIVSGFRLATDGPVPIAVDGEGLLYVAMPGSRSGTIDRNDPYSASVLRFTRDGYVPSSNLRGSPIVALGYTEPSGLAVDTAHRRVWLSGRHQSWPHSLSWIPTDHSTIQRWPAEPVGGPAVAHGAMALLRDDAAQLEWLIVAADKQVRRTEVDGNGQPSRFDELARVNLRELVLTVSPEGLYVAGTNDQGQAVIRRLSISGAPKPQ